MWSLICSLVGYVLQFCYFITRNYGVALLVFALLFKLILLPSGIKQQKNQILQAKLRPKEMAIRKKYKNVNPSDRAMAQKIQMEVQEMYQREGFNPAGGCLPMLLQMPIIFALYSVVRSPLTFLLRWDADKIHNILIRAMDIAKAGNDKFTHFANEIEAIGVINANPGAFADVIGEMPKFKFLCWDLTVTPTLGWNIYLLIPVLTFVVMYGTMALQQRMTYQSAPNADAAKSMTIMNIVMPLMSAYFTTIVPSALGVYWMYQSLYGAIQQIILVKAMPLPVFTEEDYKAAERELRGQSGKRKGRPSNANLDPDRPRPRSLHRIDEYEPTPIPQPKKKPQAQDASEDASAASEVSEATESTEAKEETKAPRPSMLDGVTLKEEPKRELPKDPDPTSDANETDTTAPTEESSND